MNSDLPKVLHTLNGKPLIHHVLAAARQTNPERLIIIVGHKRDDVMRTVGEEGIRFAVQDPQLGTGHAVMQAQQELNNFVGDVVILSGDVPLLRATTLQRLIEQHRLKNAAVTVLSTQAPDPSGYGRIVRDHSYKFVKIVEHHEATAEEKDVKEINSGIYCFKADMLMGVLNEIRPNNSKGEYYLTDAVQLLNARGNITQAVDIADFWEVCGINTIAELQAAEIRMVGSKAAV